MYTKALCISVALALVLVITPFGEAQRGRGGGLRGLLGMEAVSKVDLVSAEQVQAALKMTDEQKAKTSEIVDAFRTERFEAIRTPSVRFASIREGVQKLTDETTEKLMVELDESQQKRLDEIYLQANGAPLLTIDEHLQEALQLTPDQKNKLGRGERANEEPRREASLEGVDRRFRRNQNLTREDARQQYTKLRTEADQKLLAVLTDEQREVFAKMQGEKIELDVLELRRRMFQRRGTFERPFVRQ